MNISIYSPACEDFTNNGLGILAPLECVIEEQAAGLYELTLVHPIDEGLRWAQLAPGCIIRAPAPVRESPLYEATATGEPVTITRQIWQVHNTEHGLYLRSGPGMGYRRIGKRYNGDEIIELEDAPDPWKKVCVAASGAVGYMSTKYLRKLRTETEVISPGSPGGGALRIGQSRDQLFRIYSVEQDSAAATVTARALHVFYDESGNLIDGMCEFTRPRDVNAALADMEAMLALEPRVRIRPLNLSGEISGDFSHKSPVEALLDPDGGIVRQANALLVRDNWDAFLLPDAVRDRGVTIRRGKNLIGVEVTSDASAAATRIIPVGKNANGEALYLSGTNYVDSPRAGDYPFPRIRRIEYDVQTGENGLSSDAAVRAELKRLAEAEFIEHGADLPSYGMDVDFVLLGSAQEYADFAALQAVHLYDTVTVIDELLGLRAKVRVTGYRWNCLTGQYEGVTLGEIQDVQQRVYGYSLPDGGISGTKIMNNSLGGSALRNASIEYAKIAVAAVKQLSADSLSALTARIRELVAGSITADELYAGIADISRATIERADVDWAAIRELNALIANIAQAKISTADIDWARIKDLVSDTAIITEGVGGHLMISRLAVTEANMVSLTTGELVVKGEDGHFYSLGVDAGGNIRTTRKQLGNDDVLDLSIHAGEKLVEGSVTAACLNAREIFADSALIRSLIAANLDVDALFAREAFVNLLRTSKIAGGQSIEMIAGEAGELKRLSGIEVIEGRFARADRREGEGIHIHSAFKPKQDKTRGDPYPPGGGKNLCNPDDFVQGDLIIGYHSDSEATNNISGYISVLPNTTYTRSSNCVTGDREIAFYDANKTFLSRAFGDTFTTPDGCYFVRLEWEATYSLNESWFQLELGSTATSYAPYANTPAIEGRTELNAFAGGRNLCPAVAIGDVRWAYMDYGDLFKALNALPAGTYTFSASWKLTRDISGISATDLYGISLLMKDGSYPLSFQLKWGEAGVGDVRQGSKSFTITENNAGKIDKLYLYGAGNNSVGPTGSAAIYDVQIEQGDTAASDSDPAGLYTLQFGETIYGGSVNWNTGEMLVTWGFYELDETDDFHMDSSGIWAGPNGNSFYFYPPVEGNLDSYAVSNMFRGVKRYDTDTFGNNTICIAGGGREIEFIHTDYSTIDDWKAFVTAQYAAGNPIQVAYELMQPYTIQLSPVQLSTLKGVNTVYTDADDGHVEFGHGLPEVTDSILPPASPKAGRLWLDRGATPAVLKRWSGSAWESVNDVTLIETVQDALLSKQAELEAAQRETALFLKLDSANKVVRIGQSGVTSEYRIDAFGSGVVVNNEIFSRFEGNRVLFGNMEIRRPAVGGLAFDSIRT